MIARLFLSLLILALAAPAVAMPACHTPSTTVEHAPTAHAAPEPAPQGKSHAHADAACIGCIAPSTVRPPIVAARLFDTDDRTVASVPSGAPIGQGPPATPPPRLHG